MLIVPGVCTPTKPPALVLPTPLLVIVNDAEAPLIVPLPATSSNVPAFSSELAPVTVTVEMLFVAEPNTAAPALILPPDWMRNVLTPPAAPVIPSEPHSAPGTLPVAPFWKVMLALAWLAPPGCATQTAVGQLPVPAPCPTEVIRLVVPSATTVVR